MQSHYFQSDDQPGILDIRENLLNSAESVIPKVITNREKNSLLHYVQLDLTDGILLAPNLNGINNNQKFRANFNMCVHNIHKTFSEGAEYKAKLDLGQPVIDKNLIALKEYGVLFEWEDCNYWVVGRVFVNPKPQEIDVCYEDNTPQNLIEMAFRLHSMNY